MDLFISWSKERSRLVAEALFDWISVVMQSVTPWMSTHGEKGDRWNNDISRRLSRSKMGILCLTAENLDEPWLLFEAGAIAKSGDARAMTFLLDIEPSEVKYPLAQFMHTSSSSRDDVRQMLETINARLAASRKAKSPALKQSVLAKAFELNWPELDAKLTAVRSMQVGQPARKRSADDMLEELIELARKIDRRAVTTKVLELVNPGDVVETPFGNFKVPHLRQIADGLVERAVTRLTTEGDTVLPTSEVRRLQTSLFANIPKEVHYLFKGDAILELHRAITRRGIRIQSAADKDPPASTFAMLGSAGLHPGRHVRVVDRGNRIARSDGINWIWADTESTVAS